MTLLDEAKALEKAAPPCVLAKQVLTLDVDKQQEVVDLLRSEVVNGVVAMVLNRNGFSIAETTVRLKRMGNCKCEWCGETFV